MFNRDSRGHGLKNREFYADSNILLYLSDKMHLKKVEAKNHLEVKNFAK
jgi:hypothetical protein